ncbi:MAG: MerR family transcriptional regulator [Candidatus Melainabacteria bacterium]|nr:MerR family transcriptional regulator [Candidatus Melainabacteria bacterium]
MNVMIFGRNNKNSNKNLEKSSNSDNELTLKNASSKLGISESTVKKYLKDFNLETEKSSGSGNKTVVSQDTFQALQEITKLRANGLSIQEIKELKSQEPSKNILDEVESQSLKEKENDALTKEALEQKIEEEKEKIPEEEISSIIEAEVEEVEVPEQRKRRGFNYRYVERQISSDSKRVSSLRQRLRNPNLSVQERLFFEEALERRILFLNGWKHILRWVSTK